MDKFKEIRPIVLGLAIKDDKLLVSECVDTVSNQTFYRCLGGGIEFLERRSDALKREFKEEIDVDIIIKEFLGVSENIFNFNGKDAHELVFYYSIDIPESNYREKYIDSDDGGEAKWISIHEFKNGEKVLYPKEVFSYL